MKIPLCIDSGAYSAWTRGEEIDLSEYISFIHATKEKYPDAEFEYVNLDVIGDGKASYVNWRAMRSEGLDPMPVYHVTTDIKWLHKYLRKTQRIGLGAIVSMSSPKRMWSLDRIWEDYFIDKDRLPSAKIHGMGITSFPLMKRYPWYSLDSTSWLMLGAYGKVLLPLWRKGGWDFISQPMVLAFSDDSPTRSQKGKHIDNIAPQIRKRLMEYLEYANYIFGKNEIIDGETVKIEEGVSNDHKTRCNLNAFYFSNFIKNMPFPRKMEAQKPKGFNL